MRLFALLATIAFGVVGTAQPAVAQTLTAGDVRDQPAVGFSNLVIRVDNDPSIAIASEEARVHILEALRQSGLNAVGAESLVFGKDHAERADFLLGGTVRELRCFASDQMRCVIGIEWQLLDVKRDGIVYSVLSRYMTIGGGPPKIVGNALVIGALNRLAARPRFRAAIVKGVSEPRGEAPLYPKRGYKQCSAPALEMPKSAEDALRATVVVRSSDGFGSGFLVSPDGFVLTAAHVVAGRDISVRLRDGTTREARVVRVAKNVDSALLRIAGPGTTPCLGIDVAPKNVGDETYAIGSPASEKLAFTLTRGIISGVRNFDGVVFLQTDASVSPGNSGGPLINKQGRATSIVSWKIAGGSVQGLAFGIPIEVALAGLGLVPAAETDGNLGQEIAAPIAAVARVRAEADEPDAMMSLDPVGDAEREESRRVAERDAKTPASVFVLRWGGLSLAGAGLVAALVTNGGYDESKTTHSEFAQLRLENDLSWAAVAIGGGMFVTSYMLRPALPPSKARAAASSIGVGLGPGQVVVGGQF